MPTCARRLSAVLRRLMRLPPNSERRVTRASACIVLGIIERYVEPDLRAKLKDADDDLRIIEDLGIDSLTMMEIVVLVEDVLQMTINNEELRHLRTHCDVKTFIECKVRGLPLPKPTKFIPILSRSSRLCRSSRRSCFSARLPSMRTAPTPSTRSAARSFSCRATSRTTRCCRRPSCSRRLASSPCSFLLEGQIGEAGKVVDHRTIFFTSCEGGALSPHLPPGRRC